ncbi:hypothetical protein JTE90_003285 [Oedothorax gibbosus]|uniref:Uncharacterized protein n=1 Tax=Oedothorax gibbosus TaxID=931172 RepID=A0AAV6V5R3_9ARAC|nr:hypothetical protein JTE90_003285 [Oedothorax gibbosus]
MRQAESIPPAVDFCPPTKDALPPAGLPRRSSRGNDAAAGVMMMSNQQMTSPTTSCFSSRGHDDVQSAEDITPSTNCQSSYYILSLPAAAVPVPFHPHKISLWSSRTQGVPSVPCISTMLCPTSTDKSWKE